MVEWTQKYQPKNPDEYIGKSNLRIIFGFLDNWIDSRPLKKCLLLYGTPGNGKTSLIYSLEELYNLNIIEVNASDSRNAIDIKRLIKKTSIQSFDDSIPVLLLDEVDGINAWKVLEELIDKSLMPIVMTCNDVDRIPDYITPHCITVQVEYPPIQYVFNKLKDIIKSEDLQCNDSNLMRVAERCNSVRSAILTLQRCLLSNSFRGIVPQDVDYSEYEQMRKLFSGEKVNVTFTPNTILKWAKKNNINVYELPKLVKIGKEFPNMVDIVNEYSLTLRGRVTKLLSPYYKKIKKSKPIKKKKEYVPKIKEEKQKPIEKKELFLQSTLDDDDIW